ncbi:MAG TPA: hypothetical protein DEA96_03255 [Leptospiraceae bacterium]|nr:hypothetical protein [Spirochaetaceae bacterium]HBS03957.1 hypothetical protein [Leptospiraceae bacterium]
MNDRMPGTWLPVFVRPAYFILGTILPFSAFFLPLFRPLTSTGQIALFFVTSVLAGLIPAVESVRPNSRFRILDPIALWLIFTGLVLMLFFAGPENLAAAVQSNIRIDSMEYSRVFWKDAIPYALSVHGFVDLIVTFGLALGVRRRRFIIRKAAAHENMAFRLQEVREKAGKPTGFSEFFYKKLMSKTIVFLGERFDIIHYSISAFTLSQRNAVFFFDFLDAEEDQSHWPRSISAEQFLHNLWQTSVFQGKSLYYIQRPGEMDFATIMSKNDEAHPVSDSEAAEIIGDLNVRYPLLETSIPSAKEIPNALEKDCRVLELFPSPGNRDHGQV